MCVNHTRVIHIGVVGNGLSALFRSMKLKTFTVVIIQVTI